MIALLLSGCGKPKDQQVTIYTSVDDPVARPILQEFEKSTGIKVTIITDAEATKSIGLAERVRAEKSNPQCDVWWGNEPFHTVALAEEGLLASYKSDAASEIPAKFRDAEHRWTGVGLRLRVLAAANSDQDVLNEVRGLNDLSRSDLRGKIVMSRPTAGTAGSHVASLYVLWGDENADAFFRHLRLNEMLMVGGNSIAAEAVGQGQKLLCITDNDDVDAARSAGLTLREIIPDQDSIGTLAYPTTVALVKGAAHEGAAKQLIDHLLSPAVEQKLIAAKYSKMSTRSTGVRTMDVDYPTVARKLPDAVQRATKILEGRE